jgi:chemotaxis protein MotB
MARKPKKPEKEPNHERWLVSYADFITLLFAVFVTLYAMSQSDKKKVEEVMQSIRESFGYSKSTAGTKPTIIDSTEFNIIPALKSEAGRKVIRQQGRTDLARGRARAHEKDFREVKAAIEAYLIKNAVQDKVSVDITRRGLVVSLKEAGFFDSGSAVVKPVAYPLLAKIAESLNSYTNPLRVEGHTDNVPMSSALFRSNWELSTARATNILHYMVDHYDFPPERMSATGYGEFRPVAENGSADGRGKNRRVDIILQTEESEMGEP